MTNSGLDAQDLLDQLLNAGKTLANQISEQGHEHMPALSRHGKELADKGEDFLVDKLGIADTEASREALRKGVGAGTAAGALALLLSSKSARKLATLGGLAGLGVLAWKSYKDSGGTVPKRAQDIVGLLRGPQAEIRAETLIRAMIAAAKADGNIEDAELAVINAYDAESVDVLKIVLSTPENPKTIAALADSEQAAREIYAISCRIANGLNPWERDYLDRLAIAMGLDPELAARIETDIRTG
ncbi:MAG: DUF533 domain-containing protein [Rhodobacteraceae bacterium]|nr:DUF533 domain-containing protein [Paracoccaceae bacterium]